MENIGYGIESELERPLAEVAARVDVQTNEHSELIIEAPNRTKVT
jgi:hypothetical protein